MAEKLNCEGSRSTHTQQAHPASYTISRTQDNQQSKEHILCIWTNNEEEKSRFGIEFVAMVLSCDPTTQLPITLLFWNSNPTICNENLWIRWNETATRLWTKSKFEMKRKKTSGCRLRLVCLSIRSQIITIRSPTLVVVVVLDFHKSLSTGDRLGNLLLNEKKGCENYESR